MAISRSETIRFSWNMEPEGALSHWSRIWCWTFKIYKRDKPITKLFTCETYQGHPKTTCYFFQNFQKAVNVGWLYIIIFIVYRIGSDKVRRCSTEEKGRHSTGRQFISITVVVDYFGCSTRPDIWRQHPTTVGWAAGIPLRQKRPF